MIKSEDRKRALALFEKVLESEEETGVQIHFDYSPHVNCTSIHYWPDGVSEDTHLRYIGECTCRLYEDEHFDCLAALERFVNENRKVENDG